MSMYKVKQGLHYVDGQFYKVGGTFEKDSETFAEGTNARFFDKVAAVTPATPAKTEEELAAEKAAKEAADKAKADAKAAKDAEKAAAKAKADADKAAAKAKKDAEKA